MHVDRRLIAGQILLVSIALLCGCSSEPKDPFKEWGAERNYRNFVPDTAKSVAMGKGVLRYTAAQDGILYLIDNDALVTIKDVQKPTLIITGAIPKGMEIIFDPQEKRVYAKGREGLRLRNIDPSHTHEFRFEPENR